MAGPWLVPLVELEEIGIEHGIAPVVEGSAMEGVGAALRDHVDGTAAGASVRGVVGIGLDFEFFNGIHIRRHKPRSPTGAGLLGNISSVYRELIQVVLHPVDLVCVCLIPAARAGVSRR